MLQLDIFGVGQNIHALEFHFEKFRADIMFMLFDMNPFISNALRKIVEKKHCVSPTAIHQY